MQQAGGGGGCALPRQASPAAGTETSPVAPTAGGAWAAEASARQELEFQIVVDKSSGGRLGIDVEPCARTRAAMIVSELASGSQRRAHQGLECLTSRNGGGARRSSDSDQRRTGQRRANGGGVQEECDFVDIGQKATPLIRRLTAPASECGERQRPCPFKAALNRPSRILRCRNK
mmetsp:Transcript_39238/g.125971  ORF Transcript_39238/g.125971 Transcript_39238/m.125971 type:complete len:175 (+) Transcript_39238:2-526(+)